MKKHQQSIKDQLDLDSIKSQVKQKVNTKEILKHPVTKIIIAGIAIYGVMHISKHFINAYAGLKKAIRNAKESTK